jgi:hypothetical protein
MRSTAPVLASLRPLLVVLAAFAASGCAGKTPAADSPENADESASSESSDKSEKSEQPSGKGNATIKDDDKSAPMKCGGFDIPDLAVLLAQASCELPDGTAEPKERDVKDVLAVTVSADAHVTPGSHSTVRVLFKNKGKTDLPLDFVVDPEARFTFEVYTPKGARVDKPAGQEPELPSEVSNAPVPDKKYARITIAANGTAGLTLTWDAVKTKWVSKEKAKGAVPGRGYPREPAGPLPKGKYVLRVVTPLVGVFEGDDHEVSQPRTNVQVGGG